MTSLIKNGVDFNTGEYNTVAISILVTQNLETEGI